MDFEVPPERRMLVETIGRYLRDRYPIEQRNGIAFGEPGWSRDHWRRLAELGVVGALFPEAQGGFGGSGHDIAAVFDAVGRAIVVEPLLGTLMAGRVLAEAGETDLLARMIGGDAIVLYAPDDSGVRAEQDAARWTLSGTGSVIPQLAAADALVVAAGSACFLVDPLGPGVEIRDYQLVDGGRGGDLVLDRAPARLIGPEGDALASGLLALCAEAVGIMDALRDQTLEFLRNRRQFGVPIGSFQAIKHRMAAVLLEIEQARSAVTNAASALGGPALARDRAASAAKVTVGRVGTLVAEEAIQLHGGIGMTWELPLSHYAKRLVMIGHQLGDEDHHLDRYIALGRAG